MRQPLSDDLPTVAVAHGIAEAALAVSMLEAAGIAVVPASRQTASVAWHYMNALGGIALQVPRADEAAAREVLSGFAPGHRRWRLIHVVGFVLACFLLTVPPPSSGFFVLRRPEAGRGLRSETP